MARKMALALLALVAVGLALPGAATAAQAAVSAVTGSGHCPFGCC